MTFEEMWGDYIEDVHKMKLHVKEHGFFTTTESGDEFWVVDVYIAPSHRRTKYVIDFYDGMLDMAEKSGKKYLRSMVQRKDPHFNAALKLNLKYGLTPIQETADGKIYLRKELR